jgi:acyl carrier protein
MKLEDIIGNSLAVPAATITDDLLLRDIGSWDSMAHMVLITNLEGHFGFQFTGDQIADIQSIGDIRVIVDGHNQS